MTIFPEKFDSTKGSDALPSKGNGRLGEVFPTSSLFPDHDLALRALITEVIRSCAKGREQIAEEISRLTGKSISVHMLNNYTAEGKRPNQFPACLIPAFCEVTGDDRLLRSLFSPELAQMLQLAEEIVRAEKHRRASAELVNRIAGGER